jgi:TRAF3-interacting protein 1
MGDFWKPTAEMYSSLFEKPKMAEKLLLKPPFKYLYDIIAECSKMTGFAKGILCVYSGLYTG